MGGKNIQLWLSYANPEHENGASLKVDHVHCIIFDSNANAFSNAFSFGHMKRFVAIDQRLNKLLTCKKCLAAGGLVCSHVSHDFCVWLPLQRLKPSYSSEMTKFASFCAVLAAAPPPLLLQAFGTPAPLLPCS